MFWGRVICDMVSNTERKNRIAWIDNAKGIGILCVLFGHLALNEGNNLHLFTWIYSFHMPLFFFLSGLTYRPKSTKETIRSKIKSLGIPYLLFSILTIIKHAIISIMDASFDYSQILKESLGIIIAHRGSPYYTTLWFVTCLFCVIMIMQFIELAHSRRGYLGGVTVLVIFFLGILYNHYFNRFLPWSIDIAFISVIYFYSGFVIQKILNMQNNYSLTIICISIIISVIFCYINYLVTGMSVDMYSGRYGNYFFFYVSAMAGILVIIEVSKVFGTSVKLLASIGKNSLYYYGAHLLVLEWVRAPIQLLCNSKSEFAKTAIYIVAALIFTATLSLFVPIYKKITDLFANQIDRLVLIWKYSI